MTIAHRLTKLPDCPEWCDVDHEEQQRMLATERFTADREPFHHLLLAEGVDTDTHGPLYRVALERSGGRTRLYVALESVDLNADQAEAFGLAVVRAANIMRTCPDATDAVTLKFYGDGAQGAQVFEPTAAERALGAK